MSYDISLIGPNGVCEVKRHEEGGTYAVGGITEASLNVTYNYGEAYRLADPEYDGMGAQLHDKRAVDVIPWLERMVERLGTRQYKPDYWAPTPGNAGFALSILLGWARQYPNAVFSVS